MDLSIIIINYQTKKTTSNCLKTIKTSTDKLTKEVIVVDNGSKDGSLEYLNKKHPWVKIYSSGCNLGFAQGNNFGFKKSKGKYIWLLNSDTLLKKTTIQQLYDLVLANNSDIASCQLLNPDGSTQPQGGFLPNLYRLTAWMLFVDDLPTVSWFFKPYQQRSLAFFKKDQHPGWLGGTALIIKREIYQKLNGLDKKIFMYGEDVDFCLRAAQNNIKLDYFSTPKLIHLGQASGSSKGAVLGEFKGLKYLYKKHYPLWQYFILRKLLKIGAILRIVIFGIIFKDQTRKEIYQQALKLA
ncbi:MAG: glycosyltransferase family 2 protein [Candidatus Beckwithbacteria bacterium]|nr:glycosyltransferase family 2 protein [Patescibacteria group bacterium]